jgi:uncharacterized metal-binding protein
MLVYSCSGCSNVAQLANYIAVRLDRMGIAEMSCIAGVGGDVRSLVRKATSGQPAVVVDGCPLGCAEKVLTARDVTPARVVKLHERGVRKRLHEDVPDDEREEIFRAVLAELRPLLEAENPEVAPRIAAVLDGEYAESRA